MPRRRPPRRCRRTALGSYRANARRGPARALEHHPGARARRPARRARTLIAPPPPPGRRAASATCLPDRHLGAVEELVARARGRAGCPGLNWRTRGSSVEKIAQTPLLVKSLHDELGALRVVELEAHHDAVLADADEPVRVESWISAQAAAEPIGDVVDHRPHLRPAADLEHLERDDAPELGAAAGRDVAESVLLEPRRALLGHDRHAIGYMPPVMPLPMTMMSGSIPAFAIAHISPVRIRPVCTSSAMYSAPCRSHSCFTPCR